MGRSPDLREIFDPPDEIIQAGLNGDLVFFVGAGASMLLGLPSWSGLAANALDDLRQNGFLNYSENAHVAMLAFTPGENSDQCVLVSPRR